MLIKNNEKIVFAGDSVTDMGSQNPVGEGLFDNLGQGYVRMVESLFCACYPELNIHVVNSGVSGNTSRDLLERFDRDVINLKPDYISICIGINDVWRQFDTPAIVSSQVAPEEYRKNLTVMIEKSLKSAKKVFILTPYYMEPNRNDFMRNRMDTYVDICKELAKKYDCILVDFQAMYDRFFKYKHSSFIAWDRVHPNKIGATLMAKEFLSHCDFDFNR